MDDKWLSMAEAAKKLGCSRSHVEKLTRSGKLSREKDSSNVWRYDPEWVEDLHGLPADDKEGIADVLRDLNSGVRNGQLHAEKLMQLVMVPAQLATDALRRDLEAARCRIVHLEGLVNAGMGLQQEMLNQQTDRDLSAQAAKAALERKERIVRIAESKLPQVIDRFLGGAKATTAMRLLDSLSPSVFDALLASGILTDEQEAMVRELVPPGGPADEPAVEPAVEPAAKPAVEPAVGGGTKMH